MPHWLIHGAAIAGRVLVALIGCVCFYFALFLYEEQEGVWQNRIENLWASVYDRAKVTDSLSTALFNKIAQYLVKTADIIFGSRQLSPQMFAASMNLSFAGFYAIASVGVFIALRHPTAIMNPRFNPNLANTLTMEAFEYPLLVIALILLAFLPTKYHHKSVLLLCMLPYPIGFVCLMFSQYIRARGFDETSFDKLLTVRRYEALLIVVPLSLLFSVMSDLLALITIRRILHTVSIGVSLKKVSLSMAYLTLVICIVFLLPPVLLLFLKAYSPQKLYILTGALDLASQYVFAMNATTTLYCLIPILVLIVVLLHKVMWPVLSKLLYPIASRKVVTNRALLVSVGSLCMIFAFNAEHVGIKDILKLLS